MGPAATAKGAEVALPNMKLIVGESRRKTPAQSVFKLAGSVSSWKI
jgi:hypothetical protein